MQINTMVFTYDQVYDADIREVGAKAFNTARCSNAGIIVPDGIVLPYQTFASYQSGHNLKALFQSIENHFGSIKMLIVRSSAFGEDSPGASYAGQYLSMICKNSTDEIKTACEACWSSCFAPNVEAYQQIMKQPTSGSNAGMGLLIQKVVNASSSGVCFTKDPLMVGQNDFFVINAVHGLGESMMAGEVVADHYKFDINRELFIKNDTGKQTHWRSPESPHMLTPLPHSLQGKPVLTTTQLGEIAAVAQRAVELFQDQLDIEWAYEGEKLLLLQVRPITSAARKRDFVVWTRDNVADVIPDAVTPLTWSVVKNATNDGFGNTVRALGLPIEPSELFNLFDGRVYFNQSAYQKMLSPDIKRRPLFLIKVALKYSLLLFTLKKTVTRMIHGFPEALHSLAAYPAQSAISLLKSRLDIYMALHIRIAVMMELGFLVMRALIRKHVRKDQENILIDGLVTGLNEIESTDSGTALWKLACVIKDNEDLAHKIVSSPDQSIPDILSTWGGPYYKQWQQFLNLYGHSSLKEFEIYYPRWVEDPSFIVTTLKQYILENEGIDPDTNKLSCLKKRMESEDVLLRKTPLLSRLPLKFYINHIRHCSIWRESIKQKLVRIMAEIRRQALAVAKEYSIEPLENVFFLTLEEIVQFKDSAISSELLEKIATRKHNWEKWELQKPFKEIRVCADGRQMKIPYLTGVGNRLNGLSLSSGTYTGSARIILDPTHINSFNSGDVLVTRSINPSWTPLFTLAGAIVTDMGNYLSHGAIVARELGIPAVGNLLDATERITDGQMLQVDGDAGTVTLIKEE